MTKILAELSGKYGMIYGQILDISQQEITDIKELDNIYKLKIQNNEVSIAINDEPQDLSDYLDTKEVFHC